jgi:endonuclease YncB( thermonuclease family)
VAKPPAKKLPNLGPVREDPPSETPASDDPSTPADNPSPREIAQTLGKFAAIALVLIAVLLIQHYCSQRQHTPEAGSTIASIDGDTLITGDLQIRLYGIDAPELHQTCKDAKGKAYACGRAAKAKLTTIVKRGNVGCKTKDTEASGRVIATCSADGVPDIGEQMVRDGYAVDVPVAGADPYKDAEAEAKTAKRGIWRGDFDPPSKWRQPGAF